MTRDQFKNLVDEAIVSFNVPHIVEITQDVNTQVTCVRLHREAYKDKFFAEVSYTREWIQQHTQTSGLPIIISSLKKAIFKLDEMLFGT